MILTTMTIDSFERAELMRVVEGAFDRALAAPDLARWKSCSIMAGCAAVRMAAEGELFIAAQLEGVAGECQRQVIELSKGSRNE